MRIYNRVVINIITGKTIEADWIEYEGPILLCKNGGSSSVTSVDTVYNARMAVIAETNQKYADEMYNMFKYGVTYDPTTINEQGKKTGKKILNPDYLAWEQLNIEYRNWATEQRAQPGGPATTEPPPRYPGKPPAMYVDEYIALTEAEIQGYDPDTVSEMDLIMKEIQEEAGLIPIRAETERASLQLEKEIAEAGRGLIPLQTEAEKLGLQEKIKTLEERSPVISAFYEEALKGVDVEERVAQARAGVMQDFTQGQEIMKRDLSRMGVDPSSGAGLNAFKDIGIQRATAIAGAGTQAKTEAERESFERKEKALGIGV